MSLSEIISSMNPTLWVFAALLIGWVLVQAFWFLKLALSFNKKNQLATQAEISQAAKTGFISVLGPAVSVVVVAISLIAMVGPAVTFMRCGVIGAPMWELMMAEYSAQSAGVAFGGEGFTESIFVLCIFGMTFASHSNCRALSPHQRNLTDEMIKILADKGGVSGINFGPEFLNADVTCKDSTNELIVKHIKHFINVGGTDCVGLGSDFDGIGGNLEVGSSDKVPMIWDLLHKEGISDDVIEKIAWKNHFRVIKEAMK